MSLRTWRNGDDAKVVQKIIEYNFKLLGRYLSSNTLCLSSSERKTLSGDYLRDGLIIYDTTENIWYKYTSGTWKKSPKEYHQTILEADWADNEIAIDFSTHLITNPIVQLFVKDGNSHSPVIGGVSVDNSFNIKLSTDIPFSGKVVVK